MTTTPFITVGKTAFATSTVLAGATVACSVGAALVSQVALTVILAVGATIFAGMSIASITAYVDKSSTTPTKYLENVAKHSGYAIAGMLQFVTQTLFTSLIDGIGRGIGLRVQRKIAG